MVPTSRDQSAGPHWGSAIAYPVSYRCLLAIRPVLIPSPRDSEMAKPQLGTATQVYVLDRATDKTILEMIQSGAVLIRRFGQRDQLLKLASSMGELMQPGVGMPPELHDGFVYTVQVRNEGSGLNDVHGNPIISSTNRAFSLHTDGFNLQVPPRFVLLLRVDNDGQSTPTVVSSIEKALARLPGLRNSIESLMMPSARGPVRFSEFTANHLSPRYRVNMEEVERWRDVSDACLAEESDDVLAELGSALNAVSTAVVLEPTDILVLDNWRMCHGRPQLSKDSRRRLERVWVASRQA